VPSLTTDWQYYGFDGADYDLCASSDSDAANQTIAATYASACSATFDSWTTAWPNGTGITDYIRHCPPVGVPYQWGMQHRESRTFKLDYTQHLTAGCSSPALQTTATVNRQFWYYCPANYTLTAPSGVTVPFCVRTSTTISPQKQPTCSNCSVGNPIDLVTGQKYQRESDYIGAGSFPLAWERHYRAGVWQTSYSRHLVATIVSAPTAAHTIAYMILQVYRDDGQILSFDNDQGTGAVWEGDADVVVKVTTQFDIHGNILSHTLTDENDAIETYNATGQLTSVKNRAGVTQIIGYDASSRLSTVTDSFGRSISLGYNGAGQIATMTDPAGNSYQYTYDASGNLSTVTNPDLTVRTYVYNESSNTSGANLPHALTGIVDENASRFATFQYDATGRGISSQHAGGAELTSITYNADGSASVTDAAGGSRTYSFRNIWFVGHLASVTGNPCVNCGIAASYTYDANGNLGSVVDSNGNRTGYSFSTDGRNLETQRTEAQGTGIFRTHQTQWHPSFRLPTQIILSGLNQTNFTYDANGNVLTKSITDTTVTPNIARTWTYTYDSYGRVLTADGPRTDVSDATTLVYYTCSTGFQCGQIHTITDALGHTTTFNSYNAHGQPLTITDSNGIVATLTYDLRSRLTTKQVGTETTSYSYYPTGLLEQVMQPDGSYALFTYDAAHRLTQISDGLGNSIQYTLDAMGNRTAEKSYDPASVLQRTHTRVINGLNEVYQEINAAGTAVVTTTLSYDSNGNMTGSASPLSRNTANQYDALNRVSQITDPNSGVTRFSYDGNDQTSSVVDPRFLTTTYSHNGFGDLTKVVSPDTGTATSTYDSGGNLKTTTDARSALATYSYDALNRVTQVAYSDQTINFSYDAGTNGVGRLSGASDANHSLSWSYDALGRVTGKGQVNGAIVQSVGYGYANGNVVSLVTPSGQTVTYTYSNHRVSSVAVNGTTILSSVTYDPFGPVTGWTWGNATTVTRTFDQDGNPLQIATAATTNGYTVDNASRIIGLSDSTLASNSFTFGYDLLDRVTSGNSTAISRGYTYDANSNRLTTTGTLASTETISASNNRLNSMSGGIVRTYAYDAAGNTTGFAGQSFSFNQRGRMSSMTNSGGTTNYLYNALGQLILKTGNGGTTLLMYDEAGHILGEYTASGALIQETIWMGDLPVATIQPNGASVAIYYVHTDHLGTPRKITNPSGNTVVWRWDPDTFGSVGPSIATISYNLRFPGQYYLLESGLHYNYLRDYDPQTGRYIESDPVGLHGGNNTFAYANGSPIYWSDRFGLKPGDRFSTPGQAAIDALDWIISRSPFPFPWEYAGSVYEENGSYIATDPATEYRSDTSRPSLPPGGRDAVMALYHTHGECSKGADHISGPTPGNPGSDKLQADWYKAWSYVETPGHMILRYINDPNFQQNGQVRTLRGGCACPGG
jgi:RHS repeat-associated protein